MARFLILASAAIPLCDPVPTRFVFCDVFRLWHDLFILILQVSTKRPETVRLEYADVPGMDILSSAYFKATRLLTASALAEIDRGSDSGKRQRLNYTFNDSSSLVAGKSLAIYRSRQGYSLTMTIFGFGAASLITADNDSTSALIREAHDVLEKANMDDGPELGYRKAEGDLKAELIRIQHQIAFMLKQRDLVLHSITKIHSTLDIAAA
jgi:hypothetical protein